MTVFSEDQMGGKRPDQHNIDPAEGSSSDHKWRGEGRSGDENIENEQKRELRSNPRDQPMIPESGTNPASRDLRDRKVRAREEEAEQREPSDDESDRDAERREASDREVSRREAQRREARRDESRSSRGEGSDDEEARLDETIKESFPASDPPSYP